MPEHPIFLIAPLLNPNVRICQYMPLKYFQTLLTSNKYYISRKKCFQDYREKESPIESLSFFTPVRNHNLSSDRTAEYNVHESNRRRKHAKQYGNLSKLPTSCWTQNTDENILFWERFNRIPEGSKTVKEAFQRIAEKVCIHTTIGNFVDSLDVDNYDIVCTNIHYCNDLYTSSPIQRLCLKETAYKNEEEIRFYFTNKKHLFIPKIKETDRDENHISLRVNLNLLIQKVYLSPYIETKKANRLITEWKDQYNISAHKSHLRLDYR